MMPIDREKLMRRTKAQIIDDMVVEVEETDRSRRRQMREQVESINRLMGGATDFEEIGRLQEKIVELETRLEMALEENRKLKGETTSATNIGIKLRRP